MIRFACEFRDQSLIAALNIRDRCVVLMPRLYRVYRFRGRQVINRTVLQPLGVTVAAHKLVSMHEIASPFARYRDFSTDHPGIAGAELKFDA